MFVGAYVRILRGFTHPGSPRGNSAQGLTPLARTPYTYMVMLVCPVLIRHLSRATLQLSYSSFSSYLPFSSRIRALSMKTYRATPYVCSHHPGVKTRLHDIPSHENLIANPAETPCSCCKSFRELTSTVHENYTHKATRKHNCEEP